MNAFPWLLAQNDDAAGALSGLFGFFCACTVWLIVAFGIIAGFWKVFEKAGRPGWGSLVPFYNTYLLTEIAGKEIVWWILLTFVPCVNFVAWVVICMDVAKNFGKDAMWGIGLAFLPMIFFPLLGFSDARYQPVNKMAPPPQF